MMSAAASPRAAGLPLDALSAWARDRVDGLAGFVESRLIAAGRSNLTYLLTDSTGRRLVLRRPPLRIEAQGAHDVLREYRILTALSATSPVRVPIPIAASEDNGPIDAPFYLMDFVDGVIVRDLDTAESLSQTARGRAGAAMIDELAVLHRVDPAAAGLETLGKPTGYLERNLRRWAVQVHENAPCAADLIRLHTQLLKAMPAQQTTALIHGDYRLDNCVLSPEGGVLAVLDWELSTQGDPLVDLGWMVLYWQPSAELADILPKGSGLPGFSPRDAIEGQYAAASGLDLSDLGYYVAFAAWRLAVITLGVQGRYRAGEGAGDVVDAAELTRHVEILAATTADQLRWQ